MFDGTIESLTEQAAEIVTQREIQLATLLIQYEQMMETPDGPDPHLLTQASQIVQERLRKRELDQELVHLAVVLAYHLADWSCVRNILQQYRQQKLPPYEQAWAWWHDVDMLALDRVYPLAIEEQRALISWASETLPPAHCLFTLADTTQALGWLAQGEAEEWFTRCQQLLSQTPVYPANRFDRFLLLRSMLILALRTKDDRCICNTFTMLEHIVQEDPTWERGQEVHLETLALRLAYANTTQNHAVLRACGKEAQDQCIQLAARWQPPTLLQRRCLRRLAHNLGAELYEAQDYDRARPLFEQAVRFGATTPWTYLWLADCVWTLQRDASTVTFLLQQARQRDTPAGFQAKLQRFARLAHFASLLEIKQHTPSQAHR